MNKINSQTLIEAMTRARSYLIEGVIADDYPSPDTVEALAILTDALRHAGEEQSSDIGRRVELNDGREGIITGKRNGYTVFIEGEGEIFDIEDEEDGETDSFPITVDDFEFVEEFDD